MSKHLLLSEGALDLHRAATKSKPQPATNYNKMRAKVRYLKPNKVLEGNRVGSLRCPCRVERLRPTKPTLDIARRKLR
jgi:hypothetical protein